MNMTDEQEQELMDESIHLEYRLTIYQMLKLLRVAGDMSGSRPTEAVWSWFGEAEEKIPLWQAPYELSTMSLMELAQDRQLLEMGLIEMKPDGSDFLPTPKGAMMAKCFVGSLEDLQFTHPCLPSINRPDENKI